MILELKSKRLYNEEGSKSILYVGNMFVEKFMIGIV